MHACIWETLVRKSLEGVSGVFKHYDDDLAEYQEVLEHFRENGGENDREPPLPIPKTLEDFASAGVPFASWQEAAAFEIDLNYERTRLVLDGPRRDMYHDYGSSRLHAAYQPIRPKLKQLAATDGLPVDNDFSCWGEVARNPEIYIPELEEQLSFPCKAEQLCRFITSSKVRQDKCLSVVCLLADLAIHRHSLHLLRKAPGLDLRAFLSPEPSGAV